MPADNSKKRAVPRRFWPAGAGDGAGRGVGPGFHGRDGPREVVDSFSESDEDEEEEEYDDEDDYEGRPSIDTDDMEASFMSRDDGADHDVQAADAVQQTRQEGFFRIDFGTPRNDLTDRGH